MTVTQVLSSGRVQHLHHCSLLMIGHELKQKNVPKYSQSLFAPFFLPFLMQAEQTILLNEHNDIRSRVALGKETRGGGQLSASNMNKLSYNPGLATVAQRYKSKYIC